MVPPSIRSRLPPVKGVSLRNSASGCRDKPCFECVRHIRDTKAIVGNALKIVRVRYGIPYSELPDLEVAQLTRYLSYLLLQGKERAPVAFPRRSVRRGINGLCDLQRLRRHERWELAQSLSSIKRNLPRGCIRHTPSQRPSWEARAFSSPPPSSLEYLRFCRSKVSKLFQRGWDRSYEDFVGSHVPNATARKSRQRADHLWMGRSKEFRRQCTRGPDDVGPLAARYKDVLSAGKCRPLLIFDERVDLLAPLHKMMFRHLEKNADWLLIGPPTEEKISSVCRGKVNTSIDLVSATDNLSLDVTEAILGTLLAKCVRVPGALKVLAFESLYPLVDCPSGVKQVSHGQMMGGYLSFPLLCLHSWLAASWASRFDQNARLLVFGDDTLISASEAVPASAYPPGYVLNDMKTIRAEGVVELCSTTFLLSKGRWREIRHLRRGGALVDYPGMLHFAAAVRGSVKWTDAFIRSRIGHRWGLTPSQLELHPASYPAFCRDRQFRQHRIPTPLPQRVALSSDLIMEVGEADADEVVALREHLFQYGREGGSKRDVFSPSVGRVRSTFLYRTSSRKLWSHLSYRCHLAALKVKKVEKRKVYPVPAGYTAMRYDRAVRELPRWLAGDDEC